MAASGAIRKRGAKAPASLRPAAPAPVTLGGPVTDAPLGLPPAIAETSHTDLQGGPPETFVVDDPVRATFTPPVNRGQLLALLENDRRDNARNHERALAKRQHTDADAHLAVVRYIERLKVRVDEREEL